MPRRENNDIPYATPVTMNQEPAKMTSDELNYDRIKRLRDYFQNRVDGLYSDFNAFNAHKGLLVPHQRAMALLHDIEVKQGVYDELLPVLEELNNAVALVDQQYKEV